MSEEGKTVEVAEEPTKTEAAIEPLTTRAEVKEMGWSKSEMDSAEKRGMLKVEEKKPAVPEKKVLEEKVDTNAGVKTTEPEKKAESSLPDFTFKTPEQEKVFLDAFGTGTPQRAMYFRMKNERQARQRAEQERDRLSLELQIRKDAEARARTGEPESEVDENGNAVDPEDKPLTMKQLRAVQKAEQEAIDKSQRDLNERSSKVADAMKLQEDFAKETIPDFDDTVRLAKDLVNSLDTIESPTKRGKVIKLIKDLQVAAATADKYGVDDYTASMIAYELGQMHPDYGQKKADSNGTSKADPKANGSLTPEQMKRIEENAQRRASSASVVSGSGRRTVSVDDVTIKDVLRMTPEERRSFKNKHPEKMQKLMRG